MLTMEISGLRPASVEGVWFKDISVTEADMLVNRFGEIVERSLRLRWSTPGAHVQEFNVF